MLAHITTWLDLLTGLYLSINQVIIVLFQNSLAKGRVEHPNEEANYQFGEMEDDEVDCELQRESDNLHCESK